MRGILSSLSRVLARDQAGKLIDRAIFAIGFRKIFQGRIELEADALELLDQGVVLDDVMVAQGEDAIANGNTILGGRGRRGDVALSRRRLRDGKYEKN